ncbi:MAG: glycosyltransferase family 9 protein [Candidatus Omnitrophota bacterium]
MTDEAVRTRADKKGSGARKPARKILVCRTDRFGEFLLNIPAFRSLRRAYPGARLYIACDPRVAGLARLLVPDNAAVIPFETRRHSPIELLSFSRRLKKEKFDISLIFNPTKELHLAVFLAGIPRRLGYCRKWGFLLTGTVRDTRDLGLKHEKQSNLELAALAGAGQEAPDDHRLETGEDITSLLPASFFKDGFVVMHPWTSDSVKQWPHERFLRLAKLISGDLGVNLVMAGGPAEKRVYPEFYSALAGNNIVDLTGKTSLTQLLKILSFSRLLVSGDSGPMHLAAASGTRVAAIFRNDIPGKAPRRWGPLGAGHTVLEKNSLSDISVEEVFAAVKGILNAQNTFY